jgi:MFS family permease
MNKKLLSINRLYFTGVVSVTIWVLLVWDYYHDGVPNHHLLAQEDLPSFSNWWGGLLLPLLTWFLLYRIQKRIGSDKEKKSLLLNISTHILYGFVGALLFGIVLSIFFTLRNEEVPFYMMMSLFAAALFLPIYRAECFLGFVIGMTFTFGGVLPIVIGSILALLGAMLYLLIRPAILFVSSKLINLVTTKKKNIV